MLLTNPCVDKIPSEWCITIVDFDIGDVNFDQRGFYEKMAGMHVAYNLEIGKEKGTEFAEMTRLAWKTQLEALDKVEVKEEHLVVDTSGLNDWED
jgi:hypothetical protein